VKIKESDDIADIRYTKDWILSGFLEQLLWRINQQIY
jgi:hypothetical protein